MVNDILVIIMVAFGLFAILMFILLYVYMKKNYNIRHMNYDYEKDIDKEEIDDENEEFMPIKKK